MAIVDDQPDVRAIVRLLLERAGCDVGLESSTAEDALERIPPTDDVVVILDHNLEGPLTGLQVAPLLKAHAPRVTIVLFSALDLAAEATAEPAIAAFVRKDRILDLPRVVAEVTANAESATGQPSSAAPDQSRRMSSSGASSTAHDEPSAIVDRRSAS